MRQLQGHPAKPLDDDMHAYHAKDLKRLCGLPASQIRALARAGHIQPVKRRGRLHYGFQDLVVLRTASALRAANISSQRINRTLQKLRDALPTGAALHQMSLTALGNTIAIREGPTLRESDSGQYALALEIIETKGELHVITRHDAAVLTDNSADDCFAKALALEETDAQAAYAAYEACLHADPSHTEARINLGRLLHLAGRLADAEQIYRAAHRAEAFLAFNLAVLLEDLDRESDAILSYREALALDPQLADAHFNLARLYEGIHDEKASLRHLLAYRRMTDQGST